MSGQEERLGRTTPHPSIVRKSKELRARDSFSHELVSDPLQASLRGTERLEMPRGRSASPSRGAGRGRRSSSRGPRTRGAVDAGAVDAGAGAGEGQEVVGFKSALFIDTQARVLQLPARRARVSWWAKAALLAANLPIVWLVAGTGSAAGWRSCVAPDPAGAERAVSCARWFFLDPRGGLLQVTAGFVVRILLQMSLFWSRSIPWKVPHSRPDHMCEVAGGGQQRPAPHWSQSQPAVLMLAGP